LLRVSDLSIRAGRDELVQGISFDIFRGERLGLIGESGSGKSLTCLSIIGLLDEGLHAEGSITFDDGAGPAGSITSDGDAARAGTGGDEGSGEIDLLAADEDALSRIRGDRLSMVFQEPMTALNPLMKVGDQLGEA